MHPSLQFTRSLNTKNSAGLLVADSCTQLLNFLLQLPWAHFQNVAYRADRSNECKPTLTQCEQQLSQIYSVLYSQHMITVKSTYTHLKLYLCPRSSRKHGNVADTLGTQVPRHWSQTAPPPVWRGPLTRSPQSSRTDQKLNKLPRGAMAQ